MKMNLKKTKIIKSNKSRKYNFPPKYEPSLYYFTKSEKLLVSKDINHLLTRICLTFYSQFYIPFSVLTVVDIHTEFIETK